MLVWWKKLNRLIVSLSNKIKAAGDFEMLNISNYIS